MFFHFAHILYVVLPGSDALFDRFDQRILSMCFWSDPLSARSPES